jgi:16S rRNA (uracil1498-N3)-methyltransferase
MYRFFVNPFCINEANVAFTSAQCHKILHVLRLVSGNEVQVLDGHGYEYRVRLKEISSSKVIGVIIEKKQVFRYPEKNLYIYLSLLKRENFEWALQKCTEIGVQGFIPTVYSRTVLNIDSNSQKFQRWQRITTEASEQCHRANTPELHSPINFHEALDEAQSNTMNLIPWELETKTRIQDIITNTDKVPPPVKFGLFIGPEGGLTHDEIEMAKRSGLFPVTLGKNILRSETAAIVASTIVIQSG